MGGEVIRKFISIAILLLLLPCLLITVSASELPSYGFGTMSSTSSRSSYSITGKIVPGTYNVRVKIQSLSGYPSGSVLIDSYDGTFAFNDMYELRLTYNADTDKTTIKVYNLSGTSPKIISYLNIMCTELYSTASFDGTVGDTLVDVIGIVGVVIAAVTAGDLSPLLPILCLAVAVSFLLYAIRFLILYFFR